MNFFYVSVLDANDCIYEHLYRSAKPLYPSVKQRAEDRFVARLQKADPELKILQVLTEEISIPEAIRRFRIDTDFLNPKF